MVTESQELALAFRKVLCNWVSDQRDTIAATEDAVEQLIALHNAHLGKPAALPVQHPPQFHPEEVA